MKKLILFTLIISFFSFKSNAQVEFKFMGSLEDKLTYPLTSFDHVQTSQGRVRYTSMTNLALKSHITFLDNVSFSINTGIFNHGFNHLLNDTLIVKQRAYVIPLGGQFTFGDIMGKNFFLGGEVHVPIHYKQKNWVKGDRKGKVKSNEWFGDQTMNLAPMVFLGVQINSSRYIQVKYQLDNLFNPDYNFNFRGINTKLTQSSMIELTYGSLLNFSKMRALKGMDDMHDVEIDI